MDLAFADCILKQDSRQLTRAGAEVPLEPKMFTLLEALIRRRPAVVTYDELDELLWPKVYVARTSLTRLVSELRTVLGDSPNDAQIIRTVYKTGYAFAAEVTCVGNPRRPFPGCSLVFEGRSLPLAEGENIAGRGADCTVLIDVSTVSRHHARFTVADGIASVADLSSTNLTLVNGVAISSPTILAPGDEITLGTAVLKFRAVAASAPTEMINRERPAHRG